MTIFRFLNNEDVAVLLAIEYTTVSSLSLSFILENSLSFSLPPPLFARPTFYEQSETSRPERNTQRREREKRATTRQSEEGKATS